ncbi:MAG: HD domain-containing protein [Eubacteriales bacterium]|nr:HD domain-containing protein [Eubacteriales bacterium]
MSLDYRQIFIDQYKEKIQRRGADRLLEWLMSSDFFTAPASTRFHAAYEGGLVEHSLNVYRIMMKKHFVEGEDDPESAAICTLLHDICKAGFYEVSFRNRKNDAGVWEKVPYYTINDRFPYGHGEKSVFLIERFMRLKTEEAVAIRWHMGGFDDAAKSGSFAIAHAYEQYPLAVKLHLSDLEATYLCESREEE